MLLKELLKKGTNCLKEHNIESASLEAQILLCHCLKKSKTYLITHDTDDLEHEIEERYLTLIKKRSTSYPLSYITGFKDFWTFTLKVNENVLIPRADTEILVEEALKIAPPPHSMLDLGTGSGAIILALKKELPQARAFATDLSCKALKVAKENARALNLNITFLRGAWFEALKGEDGAALIEERALKRENAGIKDEAGKEEKAGVEDMEKSRLSALGQAEEVPLKFDLIVSNPPYIEDQDPHLNQNGLNFEPQTALTSGEDGLNDLRIIINEAPRHLNLGGHLLVEHGYNQAQKVSELFLKASFSKVKTVQDLGGNDRVTCGVWEG